MPQLEWARNFPIKWNRRERLYWKSAIYLMKITRLSAFFFFFGPEIQQEALPHRGSVHCKPNEETKVITMGNMIMCILEGQTSASRFYTRSFYFTQKSIHIDSVHNFQKLWRWISSQISLDTYNMYGYIRPALLDSLYYQQGEAGTKKNDSSDPS